jgi:hypothetical protein
MTAADAKAPDVVLYSDDDVSRRPPPPLVASSTAHPPARRHCHCRHAQQRDSATSAEAWRRHGGGGSVSSGGGCSRSNLRQQASSPPHTAYRGNNIPLSSNACTIATTVTEDMITNGYTARSVRRGSMGARYYAQCRSRPKICLKFAPTLPLVDGSSSTGARHSADME